MITQERQRGDITEHTHDEYEYWHPKIRIHKQDEPDNMYSEAQETPRGLQAHPFDWKAWDAGCHAKGICQGYTSVQRRDKRCLACHLTHTSGNQYPEQAIDTHCVKCKTELEEYVYPELHHRTPEIQGIANQYWQCPHCKQLQKLVQWAEGARLETYYIAQRGHRTILWLKVSSEQWFVLVTKAYCSIQAVANSSGGYGTAYAVGNYPPQQMPDEIAVTLARRFWHKITRGYWSDIPTEE